MRTPREITPQQGGKIAPCPKTVFIFQPTRNHFVGCIVIIEHQRRRIGIWHSLLIQQRSIEPVGHRVVGPLPIEGQRKVGLAGQTDMLFLQAQRPPADRAGPRHQQIPQRNDRFQHRIHTRKIVIFPRPGTLPPAPSTILPLICGRTPEKRRPIHKIPPKMWTGRGGQRDRLIRNHPCSDITSNWVESYIEAVYYVLILQSRITVKTKTI